MFVKGVVPGLGTDMHHFRLARRIEQLLSETERDGAIARAMNNQERRSDGGDLGCRFKAVEQQGSDRQKRRACLGDIGDGTVRRFQTFRLQPISGLL